MQSAKQFQRRPVSPHMASCLFSGERTVFGGGKIGRAVGIADTP